MADPRIKTLKIKTGVVKRLTKEKLMYIKETDQQREKVEKLKESGKIIKIEYTHACPRSEKHPIARSTFFF